MRVARLFSAVTAPPPADAEAAAAADAADAATLAADSGADAPAPGDHADTSEAGAILYDAEDLALLPEELWWVEQQPPAAPPRTAARRREEQHAEGGDASAPVTDSDDSDASSASLQPLDLEEDERPIDVDKNWRPVQLHTVLADVRQSKDTVARVDALGKVEQLVRCVLAAACNCVAPLVSSEGPLEWMTCDHRPPWPPRTPHSNDDVGHIK